MKYILALLMIVSFGAKADDWNTTDKLLGGVALAATAIDFGQTRWISEHCNAQERIDCHGEDNPLIGKHPSMGRVNAYFTVVPIAAFIIADNISSEHRLVFLSIAAGIEVAVTAHNAHVGYHMAF